MLATSYAGTAGLAHAVHREGGKRTLTSHQNLMLVCALKVTALVVACSASASMTDTTLSHLKRLPEAGRYRFPTASGFATLMG